MSWEVVIKINKEQREEEYIRGLIEEFQKKEFFPLEMTAMMPVNDILPENIKKELIDYFQDYSDIILKGRKNILPKLRWTLRKIKEYDTDE